MAGGTSTGNKIGDIKKFSLRVREAQRGHLAQPGDPECLSGE